MVIGNPPYLGGRDWKDEDGRNYNYFIDKYEVAEYQFDMYVIFWERGLNILKKDGILGFITPITWLNNQKTKKLRDFILSKTSIIELVDYSDINVFKDAVVLTMIGLIKNSIPSFDNIVKLTKPINEGEITSFKSIQQKAWIDNELNIINTNLNNQDVGIISKLELIGMPLDNFSTVKFGIKLYETGKGKPPQNKEDAINQIFEAFLKKGDDYRKYLEGKDINTYQTNYKDRWLKYGENLAAPRTPDLFEGERILVRRIVGERLISTYIKDNFVTSQLLQIVKPNRGISAKLLLALLNSSLLAYYFRKKYNRIDKTFPEIRIYELRSLPIIYESSNEQLFIEQVENMLLLNKTLLELSHKFQRALEREFALDSLPKKLQDWYLLAFGDFIKELEKKKAKLSLSQKAEWEDYFLQESKKALALKTDIDNTDKEIDAMVYELYGLTKEEIEIVEKS